MLALVVVYVAISYRPTSARSSRRSTSEGLPSYNRRESLDD
jgi:hypothetical protein